MTKFKTKGAIVAVILIVIALASFLIVAPIAASPESHATSIEYLDGKREVALGLTAAARSASVLVSLTPGDGGSAVADSLADLSDNFLIVFCAIFLEKYLLTLTGFLTFKILVPIACICLAVYSLRPSPVVRSVAIKMLALGLAVFLVVPISTKISCIIEDTYGQATVVEIEVDSGGEAQESDKEKGDSSLFINVKNGLLDLVNTVEIKISEGVEKASNMMNRLIEIFAVMIVTTCLIPILVFLFLIWVVKLILGIEIRTDFSHKFLDRRKPQREIADGVEK